MVSIPIFLGALAFFGSVILPPLGLRVKVLGIGRSFRPIENIHGYETVVIPGTWYAEDLHHHTPSNLLFAASEENTEYRWTWMPPMMTDDPTAVGRGSIVVIDPKTKKSTRLTLTDFSGQFVTHGIDTYSTPEDPNSVFIFAVNHLPSQEYLDDRDTKLPKARSRIEVFNHEIGTTEAKHLRSIWHPLVKTPNDIYAVNATSIYVTNDHYYREGFMKLVENLGYQALAPWANIIHIEISDLYTKDDDSAGLTASVANEGIHNNNGLAHGQNEDEIIVIGAASGVMVLAEPSLPYPTLRVKERIQIDSALDNPSYFHDPYAEETGRDASGYVLAGLATAATFPDGKDPVMVWFLQPSSSSIPDPNTINDDEKTMMKRQQPPAMTRKIIFQDDGSTIRSASTAVLVAIDPKENQGKKQAWLFVTGPIGQGVVASKVDV